jgi:hypothetical protein
MSNTNGEHDKINSLPAKRKAGRPTVRTRDALRLIIKAVSDGCPLHGAASVAGVAYSTFCEWRRDDPDVELAILTAREQARQAALVKLRAAGDKDWRATEAWLRCAFPEDYRAKVENIQAVQIAQTLWPVITPEQLRELQERRANALRAMT